MLSGHETGTLIARDAVKVGQMIRYRQRVSIVGKTMREVETAKSIAPVITGEVIAAGREIKVKAYTGKVETLHRLNREVELFEGEVAAELKETLDLLWSLLHKSAK